MKNPRKDYQKRVDRYSKWGQVLYKEVSTVSKIRIFVALSIIAVSVFLYRIEADKVFWIIPVVLSATFIYLVSIHNKLKYIYKYALTLTDINQNSVKRLEGKWKDFRDKGEEFADDEHSYSKDLDIFGQGSLFQWINICNTHMGRVKLANMLTQPCTTKEQIVKRQEAISELSVKRWWRQRLQAEGRMIEQKDKIDNQLLTWAGERNELYLKTPVVIIVRILPVITIGAISLSYLTDLLPSIVPVILLLIQLGLLVFNIGKRSRQLGLVYKHRNSIKIYANTLRHFEKTNFESSYLNTLKEKLQNHDGVSAVKQLDKLESISENILNRENFAFFPINIVTLWDYQCIIDLEKWKMQSGHLINQWLEAIGELEALASLASLGHDNPSWTVPDIAQEPSIFVSRSLAHPLLTDKQVSNDVSFEQPATTLLITGSNMSGKSTLLRTSGINLVLAYIGAPVCAKYMKCSIMDLHTCMRISDNLEKNISSFYGELLRIKTIVEATKEKRQVFFLLDEIFKGTNSHDRHIGAKILINQLQKNGAMGMVSTHDLELGELEQESKGRVRNYHFQEHYKDNQIYFDYKLRSGVSTTRNALYLIKMAGIEDEGYSS